MKLFPLKSRTKKRVQPKKKKDAAVWITFFGIIIGVAATIYFSRPTKQLKNSNVNGDVVGRDKIIYQNNTAPLDTEKKEDVEKKIKTSKIQINRFIEDFDSQLLSITQEYQKENPKIASIFSSKHSAQSGAHISAQIELARNTKNKIDSLFLTLNRNIEDILLKDFNVRTLEENDNFKSEAILLSHEKVKVKKVYKSFEDTVKDWEKRCCGTSQQTKDFKL